MSPLDSRSGNPPRWATSGRSTAPTSPGNPVELPGGIRGLNTVVAATATNVAGSSSVISDPHPVVSSAFTVSKPRLNKKKGTATLRVSVPGPGKVTLSGKLPVAHGTAVSVGPATVTLTLKAKGKGRTKLGKQGKLRVSASIGYAPVGGAAASVTKAVVLKLQRRRRGHR